MKNILDEMEDMERESRIKSAYEFVKNTTGSIDTVFDILESHAKTTGFDEVQTEFIKKLMRTQALDTALTASYFFHHCLEKQSDASTAIHALAWERLSSQLREFMITFDPHQTFEENYENNWKHGKHNR